jgi:glucose-1-phosphatase
MTLYKEKLSTLIFDLGGVIIDLDMNYTYQAMADLLQMELSEILDWVSSSRIFTNYETGKISDAAFREFIRIKSKAPIMDDTIDDAWNAMLGTIPAQRINWVKELSRKYTMMVLSNTNAIHIRAFNEILQQSSGHSHLHHVFHHVYFSHEVGMRKPDSAIFSFILEKHGLRPDEVLFLDDTEANVMAAQSLGIPSIRILQADEQLETLFNELNGRNE